MESDFLSQSALFLRDTSNFSFWYINTRSCIRSASSATDKWSVWKWRCVIAFPDNSFPNFPMADRYPPSTPLPFLVPRVPTPVPHLVYNPSLSNRKLSLHSGQLNHICHITNQILNTACVFKSMATGGFGSNTTSTPAFGSTNIHTSTPGGLFGGTQNNTSTTPAFGGSSGFSFGE